MAASSCSSGVYPVFLTVLLREEGGRRLGVDCELARRLEGWMVDLGGALGACQDAEAAASHAFGRAG